VSELKPELGALKLTAEEVAHQPRCFGYHASSFFIRDFGSWENRPRSARV
jgi:hypothetical protein